MVRFPIEDIFKFVNGYLKKVFFFGFIFVTFTTVLPQDDVRKLERLKKTLESDVIPYLVSYEKELLAKLCERIAKHLDCCTCCQNCWRGMYVSVTKWKYFGGWASDKVYLSPSTPLYTLKKALSLSKLSDRTQITPPINVPEIRNLLERIEAVRTKRKRLEAYVEEIVFIVTNLKTAYALKSANLPELKRKAQELIIKVEKELMLMK